MEYLDVTKLKAKARRLTIAWYRRSYLQNRTVYWIFAIFVIISFTFQCLSLRQYSQYVYDLGMWNRHFWSLVHFDFGPNPLKGFNLLGDHAHFLLIALAPI